VDRPLEEVVDMMKMKLALASSVLAFALAGSALACPGHENEKTVKNEAKDVAVPANAVTASFRVNGMHCAGCESGVKEALNKLNGIYKVDVKMADKRVIVAFDKSKVTPDAIAKAIAAAGFEATAEV
jgi:copper chaperone CopZ